VGSNIKKVKIQNLEQERSELDPWSLYIYAMKAPMTREKYTIRPVDQSGSYTNSNVISLKKEVSNAI